MGGSAPCRGGREAQAASGSWVRQCLADGDSLLEVQARLGTSGSAEHSFTVEGSEVRQNGDGTYASR